MERIATNNPLKVNNGLFSHKFQIHSKIIIIFALEIYFFCFFLLTKLNISDIIRYVRLFIYWISVIMQ